MTIREEYKKFVLDIHNEPLVTIDFSGAESLFCQILDLNPPERASIDFISEGIKDAFLKNPIPNYQRYFLMSLYYGYTFFEHKYQTEKAINDAKENAAAKSEAVKKNYWGRNFHFETIEEANKKWEQVLKHREHLTDFRFHFYHIDGLPDYVISVSGDNMKLILNLLEQ